MTPEGAHLRGLGMGDFAFGDGGLCPWGWGTLLVGMVATAMASRAYMATARLLLVIPFPDQSLHLAQIQALAAQIGGYSLKEKWGKFSHDRRLYRSRASR